MVSEDLCEVDFGQVSCPEGLNVVTPNWEATNLTGEVVSEGDVEVVSIPAHGKRPHKIDPHSDPRKLWYVNRGG